MGKAMISLKKNTKDFLMLYRENECLWQKSSTNYKSQPAREKAYDKLLCKLQEIDPTVTIDDVKNKIIYHRASFRRDLKRVLEGVENKVPTHPRLWYFPLLTSVFQEEFPAISSLNLQLDESDCEKDPELSAFESEDEASLSNASPAQYVGSDVTRDRNYRKILEEVILMFRQRPCLWKSDHPYFGSRIKRKEAILPLAKKLREFDRAATVSTVKKKLEACRSAYKREVKKIRTKQQLGQHYVPKLWYFDLMTFLNEPEHDALPPSSGGVAASVQDPELVAFESEDEDSLSNASPAQYVGSDVTREQNYRKILEEVILMFRQRPCLWEVDHPDYRSQRKRKEAMLPLVKKLREFDKAATVATVKKKLASCRSAYKREVKKIRKKQQLGQHYVPKLWYFDLMIPLYVPGHDAVPPSSARVEASVQKTKSYSFKEEWIEDDDDDSSAYCDPSWSPKDGSSHEESIEMEDYQEIGSELEETTESPVKSSSALKRTHEDDRVRFDYSGRNIACKLRALDTEQRIHAEKLISDVLYNAELKNLDGKSLLLLSD